MEVLAGIASGMAVASLSIQLIQSIGTIKTFIRDVKGASGELKRLAELLDRLCALLQDVRDIMDRQTSLQGHDFPAPSTTILDCLKSCETSLQLLQGVVEKYKVSKGNGSAMTKLKDDIRFGFKTKDIASFEARIQRDVDYLHTAIGVNSTSMFMAVLPVLLQNQQAGAAMCAQLPQHMTPAQVTTGLRPDGTMISTEATFNLPSLRRKTLVLPSSKRLGVYHRRSVQYISQGWNRDNGGQILEDDPISETHEILVGWSFLKFGLQWSWKHPYGGINASLSVFPVVDNLYLLHGWFINTASIREIQELFSSGALHPFTRDLGGKSLLHVAAVYQRADVCRLLLDHGLSSDHNYDDGSRSPLTLAIQTGLDQQLGQTVDTIRLFLNNCDELDHLEDKDIGWSYHIYTMNLSTAEWLWLNIPNVLVGPQIISFKISMLKVLIEQYSGFHDTLHCARVSELLLKLVTTEMMQQYLQGTFSLVHHLFRFKPNFSIHALSSIESQQAGTRLLDLLTQLGLDVEVCMAMESGILPADDFCKLARRIVFIPGKGDSSILRWEWFLDPCESGFLLVSEHIGLGPETTVWDEIRWPFLENAPWYWSEAYEEKRTKRNLRFHRRMANKARKERARTGQRQARSRMPGAWNW